MAYGKRHHKDKSIKQVAAYLSSDLYVRLMQQVGREMITSGQKVTANDVVVAALEKYLPARKVGQ